MNLYIINSSLKYLNNNYKLVVKLSKWFYEDLILINYSENKLVKCFERKDLDCVKIIIHLNQNKDILNLNLYYSDDLDIIKLLVENGADIHKNDDYILHFVVIQNQSYEIIEFLVKNGANVNASHGEIILDACNNGRADIIKLFLDNGFTYNLDEVLKRSCYYGYYDIVELLINYNINITQEILDVVKYSDNQDIIKLINNRK
jgi:ankyrin repeat protein